MYESNVGLFGDSRCDLVQHGQHWRLALLQEVDCHDDVDVRR